MVKKLPFIFVFFTQFIGYYAFETASFYGASYINVPLQEAKSTTEIQLKFRTRQTDALLFLAAGKTDYCLIRLQAGKLKIHINLGAGESEISSPKGLRFDDLIWHEMLMTRKDVEVNLTIDRIYTTRERLPDRFSELNIFYGVFLGGISDSLDLFLGHFDFLRGCLSVVLYNGYDILKRARFRLYQSDAHAVTWTCAAEFDALQTNEISFLGDGSYMSLPNPISRTGIRWQFELKTASKESILLYNSKPVSGGRTDYVGLEISSEKLRLVVDTGSGGTEVINDVTVSDGQWHLVTMYLNRSVIGIEVDGHSALSAHALNHIGNKYLDLSDVIFVGGLELNKRASALALGMRSADTSLKGCIRNVLADGKHLGIAHAKVTQGILSACVWRYPCSDRPCISGATCLQLGVDSYQCSCSKAVCVNPNYLFENKDSQLSTSILLEILSLNTLSVSEGGKSAITSDNVNVVWDFAKYGLTDRKVVFYQTLVPRFGIISTNSAVHHQDFTYTFADLLLGDKIYYTHDGSENFNDTVKFELEFLVDRDQLLPQYLRGRHSFLLAIDISPVDDPPLLIIPESKIFSLAQGTRKVITPEYLNATDVDNSNTDLVYTVFNQSSSSLNGYLEYIDSPDLPIYTFTQADVDGKKVAYKDLKNQIANFSLPLQVTDGSFWTQAAFLRISIFPLSLRLINNTGLIVVHYTDAIISQFNLAFSSNSDDPSIRIDFQIINEPRYGVLQYSFDGTSTGKWKKVDHFTNEDIQTGRIRYLHIREMPSNDSFSFQGSINDHNPSDIYEFVINFVQLMLQFISNPIILNADVKRVKVDETNLKATTEPISLNRSAIVYTLTKIPLVSNLLLRNKVLKVNDTWTQQDVFDDKLMFELHYKTYSFVEDYASFTLSAPYCEIRGPATLILRYKPPKYLTDTVQALINPVTLTEGAQQPLLYQNLNIVKADIKTVNFKILNGPHYGYLDMYNDDLIGLEMHNITHFTSDDLVKQKVTYMHDDSESRFDNFKFVAYGNPKDDFQYVANLPIEISLRNDNPPYCVTNSGLHVVVGGDKLLTKRNLMFADSDVDTSAENITYTRQPINNGAFVLSTPPYTPLFEFTQDDINNERILFRHSGPHNGSTVIWVSDGERYTESVLHVFASAPYVKILNNSKLAVRQGDGASLTSANLYTDTNMNVPLKSIVYRILSKPTNGLLMRQKSDQPLTTFTQDDVENRLIWYRNTIDRNKSFYDQFDFDVNVGDLFDSGSFSIKIFSHVYFEPLKLVNNRTIQVEESTSVLITRNDLLVEQFGVPPSDIIYIVKESPKYGYLEMDGVAGTDETKDGGIISSFDQQILDNGKLHYVHLVTNQTYDNLLLDVTNGILWLKMLNVTFLVIPEHFYIGGGNVYVEESGSVTLPSSLFSVHSPHFDNKIVGFKLRKYPKHGYLQHTDNGLTTTVNITKWMFSQFKNSHIQYVHDGSETIEDTFTVIAFTDSGKESIPANVRIFIQPINDEPPVLVNNTGLTVWRGGFVNITSNHLAVADRDTSNSNLTYVVISAKGGHISFYLYPNISIDKFTQAHIDSGIVSFVHYGDTADSEFDVVVSDGVHSSEPIQVVIRTLMPRLDLWRNHKLQIFPLTKKPITSDLLLTLCTDPNKEIYYVIVHQPVDGVLFTEHNGQTLFVSNFSQSDVNASRIWYQHRTRSSEVVSKDKFVFNVASDFVDAIVNQIFNVEIAVSFGGLDELLNIGPVEVLEGGRVSLTFNTSNAVRFLFDSNAGLVRPTLKASLSVAPQNGTICVDRRCDDVRYFTNEQLNDGSIVYHHDDSDSETDQAVFVVYLEPGNIPLANVSVTINIKPVNDQPFRLKQDSPSLNVVQGGSVVVNRDRLLTVDADTSAHDLVYDIINRPNYGNLSVAGNGSAVSFTQEDVDAGLVTYSHFGPAQSSSFYFRVSDGRFPPVYRVFQIYVQPAVLNVSVNAGFPIVLTQGSNRTLISSAVFTIKTNLNPVDDNLIFNVTVPPKNGVLSSDDDVISAFDYRRLKSNEISYVQRNMNASGDQFIVDARFPFDSSPLSTGLKVNVTVEPWVKIAKFSPTIGVKSVINTDVLNANGLAKSTDSNPVFEIVRKPKNGKLMKIVRSSGGYNRTNRERDIVRFTQEELKSGVVYYIASKRSNATDDSFVYRLSTPFVQPATGEFRFNLLPPTEVVNTNTTGTLVDGKFHSGVNSNNNNNNKIVKLADVPPSHTVESGIRITGQDIPNMTNDSHLAAVYSLLTVCSISLLFVYLLRYRSKKRSKKDFKINVPLPPLPLPRPPDDLMPSSPRLNNNNNNKRTSSASSVVPTLQRKVIPIGLDTLTVENNFHLGYPYGTADEDWTSCDASETVVTGATYSNNNRVCNNNSNNASNPMLRKNQYWV